MPLNATEFNPTASITPQLFRAKNAPVMQLNDLQKRVRVPPPPPFALKANTSVYGRLTYGGPVPRCGPVLSLRFQLGTTPATSTSLRQGFGWQAPVM